MATQTKYENVVAREESLGQDQNGQAIQPKMFDDLPETAELEWVPIGYKAFGKIMRMTNRSIATAIREYYAKTFHEIRGVNVMYDPSHAQFVTEFYFSKNTTPCPENKMENLRDLTTISGQDRHNLYYQKQIVDNKGFGKHYTINDKTRLLLSDIMYGGRANNKPNSKVWNQPHVIDEIRVPTTDMTYDVRRSFNILVRVAGCFDFRRILTKLFGNKMIIETKPYTDEQGNTRAKNVSVEAAYEARYIKPVPNEAFVFVMNVEQFDKSAVEELVMKENPVRPIMNGIIYY
jgi:hypothetical protein